MNCIKRLATIKQQPQLWRSWRFQKSRFGDGEGGRKKERSVSKHKGDFVGKGVGVARDLGKTLWNATWINVDINVIHVAGRVSTRFDSLREYLCCRGGRMFFISPLPASLDATIYLSPSPKPAFFNHALNLVPRKYPRRVHRLVCPIPSIQLS